MQKARKEYLIDLLFAWCIKNSCAEEGGTATLFLYCEACAKPVQSLKKETTLWGEIGRTGALYLKQCCLPELQPCGA